ncbi:hypothetical protein [Amycolatopsis sp. NPDC006125]|uniref:hypothetical protein n=1 Tax=Amycolatopsis sp. NPDC006125 TaxID=3156730 RepID=UPI0033A2FC45
MTDDVTVPPIPWSVQHLPTVGGLVMPWITPRTADGRYLFGSVDRDRVGRALVNRWCGVCGRPLGAPRRADDATGRPAAPMHERTGAAPAYLDTLTLSTIRDDQCVTLSFACTWLCRTPQLATRYSAPG